MECELHYVCRCMAMIPWFAHHFYKGDKFSGIVFSSFIIGSFLYVLLLIKNKSYLKSTKSSL